MERSRSADEIRQLHEWNQQQDQRNVTNLLPLPVANTNLKFETKQTELLHTFYGLL